MPKIISTATADAPYELPQSEVKNFVLNLFAGRYKEIERLISVFDNSAIGRRHFSVPVEWVTQTHTFAERTAKFKEEAVKLAEAAVTACLEKALVPVSEINNIIYVTSTGVMTPTLDAVLFNKLGFDKHIKRTPLWGLGCAGGAAGISRAMEYTKAYPTHNALVVAVELCGLTFQKDDLSKSNIVAASLFSDGCAAALISGSENPFCSRDGLELIDSQSTIYEDSLDVMGWDIVNDGFKVIFSRDIPQIVKEYVHPNIEELLSKYEIPLENVKHYVTHPGGLKVIDAYEESLGLPQGTLNYSRNVLREHGNMSSPSVLYVLHDFLRDAKYQPDEYGLLSALGPGFSSELVLFKTA